MDKKRDLFKRYLEEKSVMDSLSKLVVSVYERQDWPTDPLTYIRDFFAVDTGGIDVAAMRQENVILAGRLTEISGATATLEKKIAELLKAKRAEEPEEVRDEEAPVE